MGPDRAEGLLAYFGPPAEAPAFFGARDLVDLFSRLATERPEAWAARYRQSGMVTAFAARPHPPLPDRGGASATNATAASPPPRAALVAELERMKADRARGKG